MYDLGITTAECKKQAEYDQLNSEQIINTTQIIIKSFNIHCSANIRTINIKLLACGKHEETEEFQ